MKKAIILSLLSAGSLLITSCQQEIKKPLIAQNKLEVELEPYKALYGNWVGDFIVKEANDSADFNDYGYSNKINILIKNIIQNKVIGQSIVAGNTTNLLGHINSIQNGEFSFDLNEWGSGKNDGVFKIIIKNDTLSGEWTANDKNAIVTKREFQLVKQKFQYNPNLMLPKNDYDDAYVDYYAAKVDTVVEKIDEKEETYVRNKYRYASDVITKINSSTKKLIEKDVKNLKKLELEILRNTIFARHGYTFKNKSYRQFFDPVEWYIPVSNDVSKDLTSIEKDNIKLLERFEKYAEDNYDTFGR